MNSTQKLKDTVTTFLKNNGQPYPNVTIRNGLVTISRYNCSNSRYTKALGLFLLLFTEQNPTAYISFEQGNMTIRPKIDISERFG